MTKTIREEIDQDALNELMMQDLAKRFPKILFEKPTDFVIELHNIYNFKHLPNGPLWKYQPEFM